MLYFGLELHARRFFRIDVDRICQARIYVLAGRLRGKQFGQKKIEKLKVEQRLSFMDLSKCGKFRCVCECWPFSESDPVNAEIPLALPCRVISRLSALGVCCDLGSYPARICHLRTHIRAARMSCGRRNLSAAKGNNVRHIPLPGNVLHLMKCLCAKWKIAMCCSSSIMFVGQK